MKFSGWVISAGLVLSAAAANAQVVAPYGIGRSPYQAVSDVDGPYAAMPQEAPGPRYPEPRYPEPRYGGPMLLLPQEVYSIVRESGFSPLGIPHQRGFVYTISVIDRSGDDGRLVIDARTGRILRFMPADRMGDNFNDEPTVGYGPAGPPPPIGMVRGAPRPPGSIPHVASRTPLVPIPRSAPQRAGVVPKPAAPLAAAPAPEPAQQSAAVQAKPAEAPPPAAAPAAVEARPAAPQMIQPTQEMPKAQGLE
jgi:hypothetical protein